jgi:penicillin G amidase
LLREDEMRKVPGIFIVSILFAAVAFGQTVRLPGMHFPGQVTRDANGIPTVEALTHHDLFFLQGYTHARDRFFQMDSLRQIASGRFAEMVGSAALPTDVQLRTLGLRRAAEFSLPALSPRTRAALQAYAQGVNASIAANPLPPEYAALELNRVEPWNAVDSVLIAKLLAFQLSFSTADIDRTVALLTYQGAGQVLGFNGQLLFFEDLFRSQPFDPAATVPDARGSAGTTPSKAAGEIASYSTDWIHPRSIELAQEWLTQLRSSPVLEPLLNHDQAKGSNLWAVAGRLTTTGNAMMANDPHLELSAPSIFHPMALRAPGLSATGHTFAGAPFIIHGQNPWLTWGSTVNPMDVTDVYQEQVVVEPANPAGLAVMYQGQREWLFPIVQTFRMNQVGSGTQNDIVVVPAGGAIPPATLIVTRRNAPIISLDVAAGTALSVQYTGFYATRELDAFYMMNEARTVEQFRDALQFFDVGSQNWSVADTTGSIAYFTSGEMPIRADLQAGQVVGLPPAFLRDGASGANDWIRQIDNLPPTQATHAQILPFSEMPQVINPPAGWFVNANNDPAGTTLDNNPFNQLRPGGGIFYLNYDYQGGFRAGRITQMLRQRLAGNGRISMADMRRIQADVAMLDAEFFTPYILSALDRARAAGANPILASFGMNPAVAAAVDRLRGWDYSTPTGIPQGYDYTDVNGQLSTPTADEIRRSVAATIYSVWRGQFIANTIDGVLAAGNLPRPGAHQTMTALQNLLLNFDTREGRGASGVNFFNVQNVDSAADRRDIIILKSLADSLELLSGEAFAPAFNRSTDLDDYRWGRLHRIVFTHRLGSVFDIPPAAGAFPAPLPGLPGIPTDGGFEVVDASSHNPRAASVNGFMFGGGPARRYVGEVTQNGIRGETSTPGGPSGIPGTPGYTNLLPLWLTNDYYQIQAVPVPPLPWRR